MNAELQQLFHEMIGKGIAAWEEGSNVVEESEGKKVLMIQDHCFNFATPETVMRVLGTIEKGESRSEEGENIVNLPEKLLLQPNLIARFTIRDLRLAVPSAYRVLKRFGLDHAGGRAMLSVATNPIWIRLLHTW